jgi:hypothetical protein
VEVWDAAHQNPPLGRATPAPDAFSLTVDTRALPNGPATWSVHAWDSAPGQSFTHDAAVSLTATIQNGGGSGGTGGSGGGSSTAFAMGSENKNGPLSDFEAQVACDVNIMQLTTGWCGDWNSWETSGCGRFAEARQFTLADSKHAVELSLPPWPHDVAGQSYAACARGDYDGHYTKIAQSLASNGIGTVVIRLGYEWDGTWFPWGTGLHETGNVNNRGPGGTAIEYGQCFKRFDAAIQAVARSASPVATFRTVMNPIHDTFRTKSSQLQQVFDAAGGKRKAGGAVDFIGMDLYDYPARGDFDASMQAGIAFAKRNGIPLSIPEWGVGGDSRAEPAVDDNGAVFIQRMAGYFANPDNGIRYASYFNCATGDCAGNHSLIAPNNPKSRAAFIAQFGNGKLGCGADARAMLRGL